MSYNTPVLREVGRAASLVLGTKTGHGDNVEPQGPSNKRPTMEMGLDD